MYESTSVAKIRLLGEALQGIQLACNGHMAVMTVTRESCAATTVWNLR